VKKTLILFGLLVFALSSAQAQKLTGAGATFPYPIYSKWFSEYSAAHPGVEINYQSIGSGGGIRQMVAGLVDFGATDMPATDEQLAPAKTKLTHIPTVLGAVVPIFNVPGVDDIKFSPDVLADIFLGKIDNWNNARIAKDNPGVKLPADQKITVVHRSDGSGTTYIFSNYLTSIDPTWASRVGTGKTLHWPVGTGAEGNAGVTSAVSHIPFSIGYVERSYSRGQPLTYAAIRNQAGNYTTPTNASITAAAAQKPHITPADFSIVNEPGPGSYPISGYSWAILYAHQTSQATGQALVSLLDWLTHTGQTYAAAESYVPLPARIQQLARTMLQQVTGPSGKHLLG
jgi:phosphate transport system substrate-binding protein